MLSRRFEQLFRQLTSAYVAYDDVPRTPDRVRDLAAARIELDQARREIAEERLVELRWGELVDSLRRTEVSDEEIARLRVQGMIND